MTRSSMEKTEINLGNVGYGPWENIPFQCPSQAQEMLFWDDIGGILGPYL